MNQRPGITYRKPTGFTLQGIRVWALLFALCGVIGDFVLGRFVNPYYGDEVTMGMQAAAAIMSVLYYCGIPLFSFLLVQGFMHTASLKNYAIRVGVLAVLAEIPYNMASTGNPLGSIVISGVFAPSTGAATADSVLGSIAISDSIRFDLDAFSLNPIFGILLAMVVLYLFRHYHGKDMKNIAIRVLAWFMAFLWAGMIKIMDANILLTIVPVLWLCRRKKGLQILCGCIATFLTCVFFASTAIDSGNFTASVGCCIAPLTFLIIHFYNGEQGDGNRVVNYLAYPAMLLAAGLIRLFAFQ